MNEGGEPRADVFHWTIAWALDTGLKLWSADETASTNTTAKQDEDFATRPALKSGEKTAGPSLYLTKRQNAGRGRGSHKWTTPQGSALLSSWSFAVAGVPQPVFSALVGLALFDACEKTWPRLAFSLKAPNDLFIADKKTAGLLIETIDQGRDIRTVVGLGLNADSAPAEVETATCLGAHLRRPLEIHEWRSFLQAWAANLNDALLAGMEPRLGAAHANRLLRALNLHPHLPEPILRVDELGQLHFANRVIHWHEL